MILDYLQNLDNYFFLLLNGCHNSFFDVVMTYISSKVFWIWFYVILLYLIIKEYKWQSILILVFVALMITITDQVSVHLFKNVFERLRPCHQEDLMLVVHTVNGCGGKYGFISSHATNVFALAFFVSKLLGKKYKWMPWLMFFWAALVGYSRVYLGVHFPGDVIVGAFVGVIIGYIMYLLYLFTAIKLMEKKIGEG